MSVAQKIALGAGAAAVAAGVTLGATGMAWAAEESPAPTSTSAESASPDSSPDPSGTTDTPMRDGRGGPGHHGGVDASALAEELGVDEAEVQAAFDDLRANEQAERTAQVTERLDAAVADGSLTQVEADGAAKAVELGLLGGGGGRR